jgi:hypothetical protein
MEPLSPKDSEYIQDLGKQFELFFGNAPNGDDSQLQQSFLGTLDLMNKYLDTNAKQTAVTEFLDIVFEPGAQMITANDPVRDREIKFAAVDDMLEKLKLGAMRTKAIQMAKDYEDDHNEVEAYKKANPDDPRPRASLKKQKGQPAESIQEAGEVKAQLRKGMPHLRDLKPIDLLDLIDEIHDGNGSFKLQNIPQPEQRTLQWYVFRNSTLTASNIYKIFCSECSQSQLILEKCQSSDASKYKNNNLNSPMHWGQKYEPVSILYYEHLNNTKVSEFGCIPHANYSYIAASPDGIVCDGAGA